MRRPLTLFMLILEDFSCLLCSSFFFKTFHDFCKTLSTFWVTTAEEISDWN